MAQRGKQPWISTVRHQPKQQQVSAAGQRQRDGGRVDDGNGEKPQRSQVREPMRHQRVMQRRRKEQRGLSEEECSYTMETSVFRKPRSPEWTLSHPEPFKCIASGQFSDA